ncbi:MAG TPA: hypothetical protein VNV66_18335 [Pilimelia sp.]|nr:hypothetical protein [Pilimelia sp.]
MLAVGVVVAGALAPPASSASARAAETECGAEAPTEARAVALALRCGRRVEVESARTGDVGLLDRESRRRPASGAPVGG